MKVDPNMVEIPDWRTQLLYESRQRIVNKIMDTLTRHLPVSDPEGLVNLAVRFEDKIYTAATSQTDYLRKISLKMLTMEAKTQETGLADSLAPNHQNPPDRGQVGGPVQLSNGSSSPATTSSAPHRSQSFRISTAASTRATRKRPARSRTNTSSKASKKQTSSATPTAVKAKRKAFKAVKLVGRQSITSSKAARMRSSVTPATQTRSRASMETTTDQVQTRARAKALSVIAAVRTRAWHKRNNAEVLLVIL